MWVPGGASLFTVFFRLENGFRPPASSSVGVDSEDVVLGPGQIAESKIVLSMNLGTLARLPKSAGGVPGVDRDRHQKGRRLR